MSGFKSLLNKHLNNLVPEPAAWNEQYCPGVKAGRVSHPQRGRRGTEARSDLPEVTPSVGAGTRAHSFPGFRLEADREGLCGLPREKRTDGCFPLWLCRINQETLSDAPPDLYF